MTKEELNSAAERWIAAGNMEQLDALLEQGAAPAGLEDSLKAVLRKACEGIFTVQSYLTETIHLARRVQKASLHLREKSPEGVSSAGELLMGCTGSVYFSPYHTAVRCMADALGFDVVELGCGISADMLPEMWRAHPRAVGMLLYEGCVLIPKTAGGCPADYCCLGRSRVLAALPGGAAQLSGESGKASVPEDFSLLIRLADMLG